jgi:hypothetical protein
MLLFEEVDNPHTRDWGDGIDMSGPVIDDNRSGNDKPIKIVRVLRFR